MSLRKGQVPGLLPVCKDVQLRWFWLRGSEEFWLHFHEVEGKGSPSVLGTLQFFSPPENASFAIGPLVCSSRSSSSSQTTRSRTSAVHRSLDSTTSASRNPQRPLRATTTTGALNGNNTNYYWGKLRHLHKGHIFEEKAAGLFPRPAKLFGRGEQVETNLFRVWEECSFLLFFLLFFLTASALAVLTETGAKQSNLNSQQTSSFFERRILKSIVPVSWSISVT